jgi:tRNA 2-thiouridine synthesizing protein A
MSDNELDVCGLRCPLVVMKVRLRIENIQIGGVLRVTTDDPLAVLDVPHFCKEAGHKITDQYNNDAGATIFLIERG